MGAVLAVGGVVFARDGAVLLIQRGRPPLEGSWTLPGGKVRPGEPLFGAIEREILEETALAVRAVREITTATLTHEGFTFEIHEIVCELLPGVRRRDARAGDDARGVRWVTVDALAALGVTDAVQRVIAAGRLAVPEEDRRV